MKTALIFILFTACFACNNRQEKTTIQKPVANVIQADTVLHIPGQVLTSEKCLKDTSYSIHISDIKTEGLMLFLTYRNRICFHASIEPSLAKIYSQLKLERIVSHTGISGLDEAFIFSAPDTVPEPDPNGESSEDVSEETFEILIGRSGSSLSKTLLISDDHYFYYHDGERNSYEYTFDTDRSFVFPTDTGGKANQLIIRNTLISITDRNRKHVCSSRYIADHPNTFSKGLFIEFLPPQKFYTPTSEESSIYQYFPGNCEGENAGRLVIGKKYKILERSQLIAYGKDYDGNVLKGRWIKIAHKTDSGDEVYVLTETR